MTTNGARPTTDASFKYPSVPPPPTPIPQATTSTNGPLATVAAIVPTTPHAARKRMTPMPTRLEYIRKPRIFLEYQSFFLREPIIEVFKDPVRLIVCKRTILSNPSDKGLRVGISNISTADKATLNRNLYEMVHAFPQNNDKQLKGIFPTAIEEEEADGKHQQIIFSKVDPTHCTLFDSKGRKLDIENALPCSCTCKIALSLLGMKTRHNEISYMLRVHQIMLKTTSEEKASDVLLFDVSDSSGDDDTSEEEEDDQM